MPPIGKHIALPPNAAVYRAGLRSAYRAKRPAFHLVFLRQMLDRDLDDVADVIVGEAIKDILPFPAGGDEVVGAEKTQLVRDGGATLS